jgi:hypothetical protein
MFIFRVKGNWRERFLHYHHRITVSNMYFAAKGFHVCNPFMELGCAGLVSEVSTSCEFTQPVCMCQWMRISGRGFLGLPQKGISVSWRYFGAQCHSSFEEGVGKDKGWHTNMYPSSGCTVTKLLAQLFFEIFKGAAIGVVCIFSETASKFASIARRLKPVIPVF